MLKSHIGGPIILTKFVEAMDGYNKTDIKLQDKVREQAFSQFMAYLYLDNADKAKYGSIMTGLNTQQSLGNNQYPKSITKSNSVLSNHWFDVTNKPNNHKKPRDHNKDREQKDARKEDEDVNLLFAQLEGKCYCCGRAGNKSPSCRKKNKPKEESAINKAQQSHAQATTLDTNMVTSVNSNNPLSSQASQQANINQVGWAGAHIKLQFYQASEMQAAASWERLH